MHTGYQLAFAMWALSALSLALVGLRLYTRIFVVKFVGSEDYMYAATGLFFVLFTLFIQISVNHGLGRDFWSLSLDDSSLAIFWSYVANTFAILGNAMAKLSMGLFLLRVVQARWQRIALWFAVAATAATSAVLAVLLWNQSTPRKASWDPLRTHGTFHLQIQPLSVGLGVWSSVVDFFFAAFPWLFIWALPSISRREKALLSSGMSLGVVAGACGIIRTVVLARIDVFNYTLNFVPYYAWAGAEIAVALVCMGIPALRPLYVKARGLTATCGNRGKAKGSHLPQHESARDEQQQHRARLDEKTSSSHSHHDHPVITPPPPAYTFPNKKAIRRDSVDDIISDYQHRSDDRGAFWGGSVIWVRNGAHTDEDVAEWPLKN
ncbi:hypothetical protein F5Y17DRAFT_446246 [Xylariaceae sp. FL0594]|nr:hypothetical protein F5Y17DRAFT_446246 [Xylariaceae sp. FL0594]